MELIPKNKKIKILDLGSGNGEFANILSKKGYKDITCVDIENTLKYNFDFACMNLNNGIFYNPKSFDVVISLALIEHLENPRHHLRECARVIKDDGCIILTTPYTQHLKARLKFLIKKVVYGFDIKDYNISGHITPIMDYDLVRICKELNLNLELGFNSNQTTMICRITKKRKRVFA